jgi:hypothetical protein
MHRMRSLFTLALVPAFLGLNAQSDLPRPGVMRTTTVAARPATVDTPTSTRPGAVTFVEDAEVKALMADYTKREHVLKGYRVQIFLNADRRQAETMRAQFLQKHPEVSAYLSYQAPNFKVRVGDLLTRLEGEKLRAELKAEFPGCYIVPDEIELPRLPE